MNFKKAALSENGFAFFQDLNYKPTSKITGNFRLGYFNTTFNARIYAYEQDVLHAGGFGMYNGRGYRLYKNIKLQILKKIAVWGRYSLSYYPKSNTIGSGLDEINGNKKQELKFQLIYTL